MDPDISAKNEVEINKEEIRNESRLISKKRASLSQCSRGTKMRRISFASVCVEIMEDVFKYLSPSRLFQVSEVSKKWNQGAKNLAKYKTIWKHHSEAEYSTMLINQIIKNCVSMKLDWKGIYKRLAYMDSKRKIRIKDDILDVKPKFNFDGIVIMCGQYWIACDSSSKPVTVNLFQLRTTETKMFSYHPVTFTKNVTAIVVLIMTAPFSSHPHLAMVGGFEDVLEIVRFDEDKKSLIFASQIKIPVSRQIKSNGKYLAVLAKDTLSVYEFIPISKTQIRISLIKTLNESLSNFIPGLEFFNNTFLTQGYSEKILNLYSIDPTDGLKKDSISYAYRQMGYKDISDIFTLNEWLLIESKVLGTAGNSYRYEVGQYSKKITKFRLCLRNVDTQYGNNGKLKLCCLGKLLVINSEKSGLSLHCITNIEDLIKLKTRNVLYANTGHAFLDFMHIHFDGKRISLVTKVAQEVAYKVYYFTPA